MTATTPTPETVLRAREIAILTAYDRSLARYRHRRRAIWAAAPNLDASGDLESVSLMVQVATDRAERSLLDIEQERAAAGGSKV